MSSLKGQRLVDVLGITNPADYKLHCARWNYREHPLDVFVATPDKWIIWNNHAPQNHYNRAYILTLAAFYPEPDTWLFCGIYKVKGGEKSEHPDNPDKTIWRYDIEPDETGKEHVGKLKVSLPDIDRAGRLNLENHTDDLVVKEVFVHGYNGEDFSGPENVNISYGLLLAQYQNIAHASWKGGLSGLDGVYLITDIKTNKRYVGSAYGEGGIWGRWEAYMRAIGGSKGLGELFSDMSEEGMKEYAEAYLQFSILESWPLNSKSDSEVIHRENHWKEVLLTRGPCGLNRN